MFPFVGLLELQCRSYATEGHPRRLGWLCSPSMVEAWGMDVVLPWPAIITAFDHLRAYGIFLLGLLVSL